MPMTAEVRRVEGDDDEMARAGRDVLVAARADVALGGLVRLDASDVDVVRGHQPSKAHTTRAMQTMSAAATIT